MKPYLLAIDIGTSACKTAVFNRAGEVIAAANEEYPVIYPRPGWAEQDPKDWWKAVCKTIRQIWKSGKMTADEIAGIGIDGQSWSAVAVDGAGNVLCNTPIWMDTRAQDICDNVNKKIGADKIFEKTGNFMRPSYTTAKILWYQKNLPEVYGRTCKILQSNSYIAFKLTGNMTQDISQGYGLHCFDMHRGRWDRELCEAFGIPLSMLPEICPSHAVIGKVSREAAKESGLAAGIPVVAGGLDAACAALGVGVIHPGDTQEQGGQAGGMSVCTDTYKADPRLILGFHVVPGKWLLQGGTTGGGGVMRWLEREFGAYEREKGEKSGKSSLELFNEAAKRIEPGCGGMVFLPYMSGERSPIWNRNARGIFYGLDFSKTKGHFIRAAMEGVAYSLRHNLETAKEAGADVDTLRATGGSANSLLWTQIKSDITGRPIVVPSSDTATTLGAALLAGVGIGMYGSFEEAVGLTVKEKRYHTPEQKYEGVYGKNYQLYLELYQQLKGTMERFGK